MSQKRILWYVVYYHNEYVESMNLDVNRYLI